MEERQPGSNKEESIIDSEAPVKSEAGKELAWQKITEGVEQQMVFDHAGVEGIEAGIKEPVVALNAHGIPTTNSCEGHHNHGRITPWISVEVPGKPMARYVDQKDFEESVYAQRGVSKELLQRDLAYLKEFSLEGQKITPEGFAELDAMLQKKHGLSEKDQESIIAAQKAMDGEIERAVTSGILSQETPEYGAWNAKNTAMLEKARGLLDEFYREREIGDQRLKIILDLKSQFASLIRNEGGGDYVDIDKEMTPQQKERYESLIGGTNDKEEQETLKIRIERYRIEFKAFTDFLREKFIGQ